MSKFLPKGFLLVLLFSLFGILYALLNKPQKGNVYSNLTLDGKVIKTVYNRALVLTSNNTLFWVYLNRYQPRVFVGDTILVEGRAKGFKIFARHLEVKRNFFQRLRVKLHLFLKRRFLKTATTKGSKKVGSALIFGENFFSKKEKKLISRLGIYHILVISGMHYALFLTFFLWIPLRWKLRYYLALVFFLFFTFLVLFPSAPAYRAFVSVALFLLAAIVERPYNSLKAWLIALGVWSFIYPYWVFSIGFWLSYLASLALIIYYGRNKTPEEDFIKNFFSKFLGLEAALAVGLVIYPLLTTFLDYISLGSFLYGVLFTFLAQLYILVSTFNLLTLWSFDIPSRVQDFLGNLFVELIYKLPKEGITVEVGKTPLWEAVLLSLLGLGILLLPLKGWKKISLLAGALSLEIILLKVF